MAVARKFFFWYTVSIESYLDEAFRLHQHKSPSVIGHNYQGALFVGLCCHVNYLAFMMLEPPSKIDWNYRE